MAINTSSRRAGVDEIAAEMDRRGAVIERLEAEIERLTRERDEAREDARLRLAQRPYDAAHAAIVPILRALLTAPVSDVEFAIESAGNEILEAAFVHAANGSGETEATRLRERVAALEAGLMAAARALEAVRSEIEADPELDFGTNSEGDGSLPGGLHTWPRREEILHNLMHAQAAARALVEGGS